MIKPKRIRGGNITSNLITSLPSHKVKAIFDGMTSSEILVNSNWEWDVENNLIMINGTRDTRTICPMETGFSSFRVS